MTEEIFLSHNHLDRELAGKVRRVLEQRGFTVFLAHEDLVPSEEWREAIKKHLASCTTVIAIVTKNFDKSSYANQEIGMALFGDKKVVPLIFDDIGAKNLPGFLEAKQAVTTSRDDLEGCLTKAIGLVPSQLLEPGLADRMALGLILFSTICLMTLSSAVLWVFLGSSVFPWGPLGGLVLGGGIAFEKYYKGSMNLMSSISWCKRNTPLILIGAACFMPASFAFEYSLSLYPTWSGGLKFDTYLNGAPYVVLWTIMFLLVGTFMLFHTTTSLGGIRRKGMRWLRGHYKSVRIYTYAVVLILLAVAAVPLDTTFVLGTPRVGLIESQEIVGSVVNVYGRIIQLRAWTTNETILHLVLPRVLLVNQVTYDIRANSTKTPTITTSGAVTGTANYDPFGDLTSVTVTINKLTPVAAIVITYYNDYNISAFALMHLATLTDQTLKNGTVQVYERFQIVNHSSNWLDLQSVPIYLEGLGRYPTNATLTMSPSESQWPTSTIQNPNGYRAASWTWGANMTYLNDYIAPYGQLNMTIFYNQL